MSVKFFGVDVETTGLDHNSEFLLEVGVVAFDENFSVIGKPFQSLIIDAEKTPRAINMMGDIPWDMHMENGLVNEIGEILDSREDQLGSKDILIEQGLRAVDVEKKFFQWVDQFDVDPGEIPLLGSSITLDRNFLTKYMPSMASFFHYRSLDATSLFLMAQTLGTNKTNLLERAEAKADVKYGDLFHDYPAHRVIHDILHSASVCIESTKAIQFSDFVR